MFYYSVRKWKEYILYGYTIIFIFFLFRIKAEKAMLQINKRGEKKKSNGF